MLAAKAFNLSGVMYVIDSIDVASIVAVLSQGVAI